MSTELIDLVPAVQSGALAPEDSTIPVKQLLRWQDDGGAIPVSA